MSVTQPSAPVSIEHRVVIWSFSIFNINSPVIFAGALTIFAGALTRGPTLVTGSDKRRQTSVFNGLVFCDASAALFG